MHMAEGPDKVLCCIVRTRAGKKQVIGPSTVAVSYQHDLREARTPPYEPVVKHIHYRHRTFLLRLDAIRRHTRCHCQDATLECHPKMINLSSYTHLPTVHRYVPTC
jgi:hypothetical protein